MPHLTLLFTPCVDRMVDMPALCQDLANAMRAQVDEDGKPVFPIGGIRVLAFPAQYSAVADCGSAGRKAGGSGDYGFIYLNLRMGRGRTPATHKKVGDALTAVAKRAFDKALQNEHVGITLQIDEGPEVYDSKTSSLHPLFR